MNRAIEILGVLVIIVVPTVLIILDGRDSFRGIRDWIKERKEKKEKG